MIPIVWQEINTKAGREMTKVIQKIHTNTKSRFVRAGRKDGFPPEFVNQIKEHNNQRQSLSLSVSVQQVKVEARRLDPVGCKELSHDALRKHIACLLD
jgi:hypothetical protein